MTLIDYAARELSREIGKRSREFYEFVMPAIDMYEDENGLIVKIDLPGFKRDEIKISIEEDILSIRAKRMEPEDERLGTILYKQRPVQIDKRTSYAVFCLKKKIAVLVGIVLGVVLISRYLREPDNRRRVAERIGSIPVIGRLLPQLRFLWRRI